MFFSSTILLSSALSGVLMFQKPPAPAPPAPVGVVLPIGVGPADAPPAAAPHDAPVAVDTNDALGSGDQILIRVVDVPEIDGKTIGLDRRGNIALPEVGQVHAAGLTPDALEAVLAERLSKILQHPDVSVSVIERRSQQVTVLGSVGSPGVHQLLGDRTLYEVLSLAGGLRNDAGYTIIITRQDEWGAIPLPNAAPDSTGKFSVASVGVRGVLDGSKPEENIHVKPNDVITVPKGEIIYVVGAVSRAGGYMLNDKRSLSALQILSLAGGLDRLAGSKDSKIMRAVRGSDNRDEISIDLKRILQGKDPDVQLQADDILFVPTSAAKNAAFRTIDILTGAAGSLIYRVP